MVQPYVVKKASGQRLHSSTAGNNESSFKKSGRQIRKRDDLKLAHRLHGPFNEENAHGAPTPSPTNKS
jgi:hypothetical protein